MKSIWQETKLPAFPKLCGDVRTDVLIIGGGLAGLLTAYFLQQSGVKYMLVEKGRICGGNTGNTTAKLTLQHGLIYDKITRSRGPEAAAQYFGANSAALAQYARLCADIDCDYEQRDNYVYSLEHPRRLARETAALQALGCKAELCTELPLPLKTLGAVRVPEQAQFNPLKFAAGLCAGLQICENTPVREMVGTTAVTDGGKITADRVVCATHFPFMNKRGAYFLKLYQHRSYVIALENAPDVGGMYVDESDAGLSFRTYGDFLLLGGGGGRTGKKCGGWEALRAFAQSSYPAAREKYFWAAQDCMSLDGVPYIGAYARHAPAFYVETGFHKWGMSGSMVAAMLVCDRILGRKNEFSAVFEPSRSILKPQLFLNAFEALANLLRPSPRTCPHLGCALRWNSAERSWDCACHGSRFSEAGRVLDNPANGDLERRSGA